MLDVFFIFQFFIFNRVAMAERAVPEEMAKPDKEWVKLFLRFRFPLK